MPSRYRKVLNRRSRRYVNPNGQVAQIIKSRRRSRVGADMRRSRRCGGSSRPSPTASATVYKSGTIKEGNNGELWKVKIVAGGVHRWIRA